jgi:hypothetical protein
MPCATRVPMQATDDLRTRIGEEFSPRMVFAHTSLRATQPD